MKPDEDLKGLIQGWLPPPQSPDLNDRMLARYRRGRGWRTHWNRFRKARISIPVPLIAGVAVAACLLLFLIRHAEDAEDRMAGFVPVASPSMTVISAEEHP